eukprot:Partr_v1_DN28545_c0_g1_i5_m73313 putative to reverse transcriptase
MRQFLELEGQNFEFDEELGLLYRRLENRRMPYIPWEARADYVDNTHRGVGHLGWLQVYENMKQRAWWPGMRNDIKEWIMRCPDCQIHSRDDLQVHEEAHIMNWELKPFERWSLDFVGILPTTESGNRWIITAVDHATRWPIARALKNATHDEIAKFIYEEIVKNFGVPGEIVTDRGRNFGKGRWNRILICHAKHRKTSAFHALQMER